MPKMTLHFTNARRQLTAIEGWLSELLRDAFSESAKLAPLQDTDVIVSAGKFVIPEHGYAGFAPEKGLIFVTVDPECPALRANPDRSLEKMLAHELHHCARWDGPGYGKTLGEALVSEGLAGHFAQEVKGGDARPWENLPIAALLPFVAKAQGDWRNDRYGHSDWFYGLGETPRWLGYSLGHQLVQRYLSAHPEASASGLVHAEAEAFRPYLGDIG